MDTTSIMLILVAALAIIAIVALLQARTGGNAAQAEPISLEIGTERYYFEADNWNAILSHLTATDWEAIRALDQARENLRGNPNPANQAAFNFWQPEVYRAYQRAALAWFSTSQGKQWLALRDVPAPSK